MLGIVEDVYALLGTQPHMLLGRWLDAARAWGQSPAEKAMMEFNARNQLTLWGPRGEIADYASKQWSGLMRDYYLRRWQMFFARVGAALRDGAEAMPRRTMASKSHSKCATTDRAGVARTPLHT